jgi:hypothetical protein
VKERPILFSAPMVRAILDGRKTQTRRIVKPQPEWVKDGVMYWRRNVTMVSRHPCPFGQPGDRLWVRETWMPDAPCDGKWGHYQFYNCKESKIDEIPKRFRTPAHCIYKASFGVEVAWRPSIHMPRWASRITLEIIKVRVEQLNDISEEDALAEGVGEFGEYVPGCSASTPKDAFEFLWEAIYGEGSWAANPWVWVVEFKKWEGGAAGAAEGGGRAGGADGEGAGTGGGAQ